MSEPVSGVGPGFDSFAERPDVGPAGDSKPRQAVAGSCWEVALVSHRIDSAVGDVAFLEPEGELPDLPERRLDQLLDVEEHPAVVPEIDRTMVHEAVSVAGEVVGPDA